MFFYLVTMKSLHPIPYQLVFLRVHKKPFEVTWLKFFILLNSGTERASNLSKVTQHIIHIDRKSVV